MYHVSTLLPLNPKDEQQLERKNMIGNDIVAVVFTEDDQPFIPNTIKSHMIHIIAVVRPKSDPATGTVQGYELGIVFKDRMNGWISCDDGKILHSDDGGYHWAEYDQFTTNALRSITLCPDGDLLTVGDNGVIYRIRPR